MRYLFIMILIILNLSAIGQSHEYPYIKPLFDFNPQKPIFKFTREQTDNQKRFLRFYALTGYREGIDEISPLFGINFDGKSDSLSKTRRLFMYNLSIEEMLTHGMVSRDHVILEVKDPSKYRYLPEYGPKENWMRKNAHCFELLMPEGTLSISLLDKFLSSVLQVKIAKEKRNIKVLVLERTSKLEKFRSKKNYKEYIDGNGKFKNVTFAALKNFLRSDTIPFIDETQFSGRIDLDLVIDDWTDINKINNQLQKYDLTLSTKKRDVEMLIITEIN